MFGHCPSIRPGQSAISKHRGCALYNKTVVMPAKAGIQ